MNRESVGEPVAIILAAGKSTRMKSELPKVLHEICGEPMLSYVLDAVEGAGIRRMILVVGFGADLVKERFKDRPGVEFVLQTEQKGTGHAVKVCQEALAGHEGPVLVVAGDGPMVRAEMLAKMLERRNSLGAKAFIASVPVADATGLGRIVRDEGGHFVGIVEHKDATEEQRKIKEVNYSFYCFDGPALFATLEKVRPNNQQGEYYLTDVPALLHSEGAIVAAEPLATEADSFGINNRQHLAEAHALMQQRIQNRLMESGVTIVDPRNTYIDANVHIGADSVILPFTVMRGPSQIGKNCRIGPFAHIREHTELADGVQVGAFVEIVRSEMGAASVAKHLAYLGDARIGRDVNVGAGVVTANFEDGVKSPTTIADQAFLGSGSVLVAPVAIGEAAIIGAGAVVPKNHDVQPGELVVGVPARPMKKKAKTK